MEYIKVIWAHIDVLFAFFALVISSIGLWQSYRAIKLSHKTYELNYKPPIISIQNASRDPIPNDIRKTPQDESFIRVTITNPSSFGNRVQLDASEEFKNEVVRGIPCLREESGKDIGKKSFGTMIALPSSGQVFFDIFLNKKKKEDFSGNSYSVKITDINKNVVEGSFTL